MATLSAAHSAIPDDLTTRERCQMCHRYSPVGFHVPDDVWEASVHPHWRNGPLCIMCFAAGADERGVRWDDDIVFYPVSLRTHMDAKPQRRSLCSRKHYMGVECPEPRCWWNG